MEIKVKKTTATSDQTTATLELTKGLKLTDSVKSRINNDVGQFLIENIITTVGKAKSPIDGGDWAPKLSKEYAKKKRDEGLSATPDMQETGALLDALTFEETDDGIEIGWFGDQAPKADGHNNFSGKSDLPRRQSLPDVGEDFISAIQSGIEKIVSDSLADGMEFDSEDFDGIDTRTELYDVLDEYFPDMSRTEIKAIITRTPDFARFLDDEDLLELL